MSGEKLWIERTKLGIVHDLTRKIQAEIRIIIIRFQLIKHNHREKCRIQKPPPTAEPHQLHVFHHLLKVVTARLQLLYLGGRCLEGWIYIPFLVANLPKFPGWRMLLNHPDLVHKMSFQILEVEKSQDPSPQTELAELSKRARSGASHRDSRDREPGVKRQ